MSGLWGECWAVLHDHHDDPRDSALALRFLGAVHCPVLQGKAPQLAACYPSVGGDSNRDDLWTRFWDVLENHEVVLRELVHRPVQTNEVGRCAAFLGGFLEVVGQTGLPLRLRQCTRLGRGCAGRRRSWRGNRGLSLLAWQYLSDMDRARFERVMAAAGEGATHSKPLAWLRFEPAGNVAEVRLQLWPGGKDRLLARSGFHGKPAQWLGHEN